MGMERAQGGSTPAKRVKRTHSPEFKAGVIEACEARDASVAGVALVHGVNANVVRKSIINKSHAAATGGAARLLPVRILTGVTAMVKSVVGQAIEVELGGAIIRVRADFDAAALRDLVRFPRYTLLR